jgi:hypothetical protein
VVAEGNEEDLSSEGYALRWFPFAHSISLYIFTHNIRSKSIGTVFLTKKFPTMREGDQRRLSVQRLIPLSSTPKTKTALDLNIDLRSASLRRRVMRGWRPGGGIDESKGHAAWKDITSGTGEEEEEDVMEDGEPDEDDGEDDDEEEDMRWKGGKGV